MQLYSFPPNVPAPERDYCLFLDFDGTLVDLAPTPGEVRADGELIDLLGRTAAGLGGAVAIVSGRSIDVIDELIAPLRLPVAGIHGAERRSTAGTVYRRAARDSRLELLRSDLGEFVSQHDGLLLEDKGVALAVHFRLAPFLQTKVYRRVEALKAELGDDLELMHGNCVLEIKPTGHDKATAVEAFMQEEPFVGRSPIFIGDDLTDRNGFAAVERLDGMAIAVGSRVSTRWKLRDPAAVRLWLEDFNRMSVRPLEY